MPQDSPSEELEHSSREHNLLQILVQSSPLRCGTCSECCTHSMREDSLMLSLPHMKLPSPPPDEDEEEAYFKQRHHHRHHLKHEASPSNTSSSPARSKSYEIQVNNLSYKIIPGRIAVATASLLNKLPPLLESRYVLRNINCVARPGELLAIAGPSGAGKSTLLEILAGRISTLPGSILVNGEPMNPSSFRRLTGYVMQHDALSPLLTVEETLMFSAQLRLPASMSLSAKKSRVESLLVELGLQSVATSRIGSDSVRGVSGGERRRVSIGVDVIHNPAVLLLDEPTSGLDSAAALQVVAMLHNMAKLHERTIILSIHQPGIRILELISSILLLAKGQVVHSGSLEVLAEKLSTTGSNLPAHFNVVEYAIEAIDMLEAQAPSSLDQVASKSHRSLKDLFDQVSLKSTSSQFHREKPSFANPRPGEILLLTKRCGKIMLRTRQLSAARTLQAVFAGLALGTIFLRLGHDLRGVQERYGFFAFTLTFLVTSTSEALPMFLEERQIFMRETSRGAYRVSSYVISNALTFLPFLFIFSVLYTVPTYSLVGLYPSLGAYAFFLLIVWIAVVVANSIVAFFSALVPNYIMGNTLITGLLGAFFLFSGYFITESRIPKYWLFMHYLSVFKYPLDAMLINEYSPMADKCFGKVIEGICTLTGRDVLAQSGLEDSNKWYDLVVMVAFAVAYRVLSYIALRFQPRHRQE